MRCLVTGAYGFIGSEVCRALQRRGWQVVGAGRDPNLGRRLLPEIEWLACDFNTDLTPEIWRPRLEGLDAVVNCVGILQSSRVDSAERVHLEAPTALFRAAEGAGVRRLIQISAMSAEDEVATDYARLKRAAEQALDSIDTSWLVVKPSLVVGRGSYGGSSMIRGLAGLPCVTPLPGKADQQFQPIALADLAEGVARLAEADAPRRTTLYAPGPEVRLLGEVVEATRRWLGFAPTRVLRIPDLALRAALRLGDAWVWFGNRTAMCTTAFEQMAYRGAADPAPFAAATGLTLKSLEQALAETPSTLQDRLHARLAWPGMALRLALVAVWIFDALAVFWPARVAVFLQARWNASFVDLVFLVSTLGLSLTELVCAFLFLRDRWVRPAGVALIAVYLLCLAAMTAYAAATGLSLLGWQGALVVKLFAVAVVMAMAEER